jgi:16S rRNA (cytidine1402-2'-O)-methyltransferase
MSTLYLVGTPIGNLSDFSPRGVETLRAVDWIAAEDTRHSGKLLKQFGIESRLIAYHDHNETQAAQTILERLGEGDVALLSDAGMPGLNDPGYVLVREALDAGHLVSPVPGPSAPVTALVASGLPADSFLFLGYLPRKRAGRKSLLAENTEQPHTLVFLETPHRLLDALADLQEVLGDRRAAAAREMTKLHEEFVRGTLSEIRAHFEASAPRGEFTLVVAGAALGETRWSEVDLEEGIRSGLAAGEGASGLAKRLAGESGWNRREVYRRIIERGQI